MFILDVRVLNCKQQDAVSCVKSLETLRMLLGWSRQEDSSLRAERPQWEVNGDKVKIRWTTLGTSDSKKDDPDDVVHMG